MSYAKHTVWVLNVNYLEGWKLVNETKRYGAPLAVDRFSFWLSHRSAVEMEFVLGVIVGGGSTVYLTAQNDEGTEITVPLTSRAQLGRVVPDPRLPRWLSAEDERALDASISALVMPAVVATDGGLIASGLPASPLRIACDLDDD